MFSNTTRLLQIIAAILLFEMRCFPNDDVETASLSLQFVMDDYIPRVQILRPVGLTLEMIGKPSLVSQSLEVDAGTLGIRNIVVAIRQPNEPLPVEQVSSEDRVFRKKFVTIFDECADPRTIWTKPNDGIILKDSTKFFVKNFKERNNDSTNHAVVKQQNGEFELDCASLEVGFHPLDCSTAPWITLNILVWPNDLVCKSNEQGLVLLEGLPTNTDLELQVFHERAVGRRITNLNVGGRLQAKKRGVFTFRLDPGNNDLGQIRVKGREFSD